MFQGYHFFVDYSGTNVEAQLWTDPFTPVRSEEERIWNVEIYPNGNNLQVLTFRKQASGDFVELNRDPNLNTPLDRFTSIVKSHEK